MNDDGMIVLFDEHCILCHGSVVFIIRRDPRRRFRFASLQSPAGRRMLAGAGGVETGRDTMILLEGGRMYDRSTAALRIARKLNRLWPLCYVFIAVPRPIRDALYQWIARRRYAWFGRVEQCLLPTPDIRDRFVA